MRIALFCTTLPSINRKPGGVEMAVHRLANALSDRSDCQVTVLTLSDQKPSGAKYNIVRLFPNWPWLRDKKIARLFILPALLNFVDMRGFDVVHLQGDDWFYFRRPLPSVRTLNGSALREAQSANSCKRKIMQYLIYPLEHLSARLAYLPLALGPDTAEIYSIEQLIDYGVDGDVFMPGRKLSSPRVFFIGTWGGRKRGHFVFDKFVNEILPVIPSAELVMACEKEMVPSHPRVHAVGFPLKKDLARMFREAWVFAYPSVYEGFGIPYIEAMASGTAIVSSENTGAEYVLDHGRCGKLVKDQDFGAAVLHLLQSEEDRKRYVQIGLERAQNFSWEIVAEHHRKMYSLAMDEWYSHCEGKGKQ